LKIEIVLLAFFMHGLPNDAGRSCSDVDAKQFLYEEPYRDLFIKPQTLSIGRVCNHNHT
jgi:hypothetical protein